MAENIIMNFDASNFTADPNSLLNGLAGGFVGGILASLGALAILVALAIYVYQAMAWMKIANDRKYKNSWLAWIPIGATAMRLQLGKKFHWAWAFLWLLPVIGWIAIVVLTTISIWNIVEMRKYPGWISLAYPLSFTPKLSGIGSILYWIMIGIVAWRKPSKK